MFNGSQSPKCHFATLQIHSMSICTLMRLISQRTHSSPDNGLSECRLPSITRTKTPMSDCQMRACAECLPVINIPQCNRLSVRPPHCPARPCPSGRIRCADDDIVWSIRHAFARACNLYFMRCHVRVADAEGGRALDEVASSNAAHKKTPVSGMRECVALAISGVILICPHSRLARTARAGGKKRWRRVLGRVCPFLLFSLCVC